MNHILFCILLLRFFGSLFLKCTVQINELNNHGFQRWLQTSGCFNPTLASVVVYLLI